MEIVEERKRGVHLDDPVRLCQDHRGDEYATNSLAQERFDLDPGNHTVQTVGEVEAGCGDRQPPSVCWARPEQVVALPSSQKQLSAEYLGQSAGLSRGVKGVAGHFVLRAGSTCATGLLCACWLS